jgi:flagellar biosynthetic protein FlhB
VAGEKTEKPTEQRKRQARKDGTIARTPDVGTWGGMLVASILLPMVAGRIMQTGQQLWFTSLSVITDPDPVRALIIFKSAMKAAAIAIAPLSVGLFVFGIVASGVQGGLRPASKLFKPDFKRLNPWKGAKKNFGGAALWEAAKALIKTVVLATVVYYSMRRVVPELLASTAMPVGTLISTIGGALISILRAAAAAGLVLAVADYAMVRRRVNKQLMMTKQEVKEEHKRSEGDPHMKGLIRSRQLEMARQRMMSALLKSDVVLVNPTHVAVALRYEPAKGAPRVVARGAGIIAQKIREKAVEHRIPMVQDVALARALYQACDLGDEIPVEFFTAVARVLAFVMMLKSKGSAAGLHTNVYTGVS